MTETFKCLLSDKVFKLVVVTYCDKCDKDRTMVYVYTLRGKPVYQCQCKHEVVYEGS